MHELNIIQLLSATWQTIYMVFISSFISLLCGLGIGILLWLTGKSGFWRQGLLNQGLGFIVNIVRSVPYIILLIALIPLTRLMVGTSIGTNAAIVSLTVAAIPFFARITETSLSEVHKGLIDAAQSMGATTGQIIFRVMLPEASSNLIKGATLTIIGLIGYSAMAGVVGGGGLGQLAIDYGYERFDVTVMIETVVLLVIIVQLIQIAGDYLAKSRKMFWVWAFSLLLWVVCIGAQVWPTTVPVDSLKVGVMSGPVSMDVMHAAQKVAWQKYHLKLKLVTFDGYVLPNTALNGGSIDANIFQHVPYLNSQIKAHGYKLTPIAKTFVYPLGIYSHKIKHISQLKNGAIVAIPNDPSNEGRAMLILQKAGLVKLAKGTGLFGTPRSVVSNPKHLVFKTLSAAQLPRVLNDASLVAITDNFAKSVGLTLNDAVLKEGPDSPYANVIVVRTADVNRPIFQKLIEAMHSKPVIAATLKAYPNGAAIPAWTSSSAMMRSR